MYEVYDIMHKNQFFWWNLIYLINGYRILKYAIKETKYPTIVKSKTGVWMSTCSKID